MDLHRKHIFSVLKIHDNVANEKGQRRLLPLFLKENKLSDTV